MCSVEIGNQPILHGWWSNRLNALDEEISSNRYAQGLVTCNYVDILPCTYHTQYANELTYTANNDGLTHSAECPACGTVTGEHEWGDGNKCATCGASKVATVTVGDGEPVAYANIVAAWAAAKGHPEGATVDVLTSVYPTEPLTVEDGDNITLTSAEGRSIAKYYNADESDRAVVAVNGGSFVLDGATISSNNEKIVGIWSTGGTVRIKNGSISSTGNVALQVSGGSVSVTGGSITSDGGDALWVAGGSVTLAGGTLSASFYGQAINRSDGGTVNELLEYGYAFFGMDGYRCVVDDSATSIGGKIIVQRLPMLASVSATADGDTTATYGYEAPLATLTATPEFNWQDETTTVSYQWFLDGESVEGATEATYAVPTGLAAGAHSYVCKATCEDTTAESEPVVVTVAKKEVSLSLSGEATKLYDGTTTGPVDVTVQVDGVLAADEGKVLLADGYTLTYDSEKRSGQGGRTLTLSNASLTGDAAGNYRLPNELPTFAGTIEGELVSNGEYGVDWYYLDDKEDKDYYAAPNLVIVGEGKQTIRMGKGVLGSTDMRIDVRLSSNNKTADVTLDGVNIDTTSLQHVVPLNVAVGALNLTLVGDNSLTTVSYAAILCDGKGERLTIGGDGSLTATVSGNDNGGAAIGTRGDVTRTPNITITGGRHRLTPASGKNALGTATGAAGNGVTVTGGSFADASAYVAAPDSGTWVQLSSKEDAAAGFCWAVIPEGSYYVENFKTGMAGAGVSEDDPSSWLVPASTGENRAFAGWYESAEEGAEVHEPTSGLAYARFVEAAKQIEPGAQGSEDSYTAVINYLGGSLRAGGADAGTADLRLGYCVRLPEGCVGSEDMAADAPTGWLANWGWDWGVDGRLDNALKGQNQLVAGAGNAASQVPAGMPRAVTTNLVVTGIPKEAFGKQISARIRVGYVTPDGTHVRLEDNAIRSRSVNEIAQKILDSAAATDAERSLAESLLDL